MALTKETRELVPARRVLGSAVGNPHGIALGKIAELLVDRASGETAFAVLSVGGVLGFGSKQLPLPWPAFLYELQYDSYVVDLKHEVVDAPPPLDVANPPAWNDPLWQQYLYNYYGPTAPWGQVVGDPAATRPADGRPADMRPSGLLSLRTVEGAAVVDPQGRALGKVDDIMLYRYAGAVAFVVLIYDGIAGHGDKRFPVPWNVAVYDADRRSMILDRPQSALVAAPSYTKAHQPDWNDPAWVRSVNAHYGV